MKLNIHIVTHPIIQQLTSKLKNNSTNHIAQDKTSQQLGIFLIYETIRNWLKNQELYIKNIYFIKRFILANPKDSCMIITNIPQNFNLIQEVQGFIPNCQTVLVNICKADNGWQVNPLFNFIPSRINENKKIIILDKDLHLETVIVLINYLTTNKHIKLSQIRISSITCNIQTLQILSDKYPKLNIYTTEIITDYKHSLAI
uniref:Uracil phosphoribosyltransferase n=1 Tax=Rhodogorgon sp. TaxID=2485824 RepID=A0A3G3MHU0_9FLOR|nr:uracil phosphoribosyltransferase [Rhodogorgon sp.]